MENLYTGLFTLEKLTREDLEEVLPIIELAFETAIVESLTEEQMMQLEMLGEDNLGQEDPAVTLFAETTDAYKIIVDGQMAGVASVKRKSEGKRNELDLLCIAPEYHSKGIGLKVLEQLEKGYPEAEYWETTTPWFVLKNIHFYVNKCGYSIVEID